MEKIIQQFSAAFLGQLDFPLLVKLSQSTFLMLPLLGL